MQPKTSVTHPSTAPTREHSTTGSVTSADGTTIGYRQYGHGPGIVLVQGGMGSAPNFMQLAEALSRAFTVYVPDRRGRGLSGPYGNDYSIQKDVEDVDALLTKTLRAEHRRPDRAPSGTHPPRHSQSRHLRTGAVRQRLHSA